MGYIGIFIFFIHIIITHVLLDARHWIHCSGGGGGDNNNNNGDNNNFNNDINNDKWS